MRWEGEELGENYVVAGAGALRISFLRGMHWEYFYDEPGSALVRVYRRMGKLRRALPALRSRNFFYYNIESRPGDGLIAFRRQAAGLDGAPDQIIDCLSNERISPFRPETSRDATRTASIRLDVSAKPFQAMS